MNKLKQLFAIALSAASLAFAGSAMAQTDPAAAGEAPDVLVKRISLEVLNTAKADKGIQAGNQRRILDLVEAKILPYVDFKRMTALAAGRFWRQATPEQQTQLANEFRTLLVYMYSGALAQVKDQQLEFKPMRGTAADNEVEVRSQVVQPGEPIQLSYRLEKLPSGWKIYDINVLGAWLVETYKGNFAAEIGKSGVDGLINVLAEKNKKLAAGAGVASEEQKPAVHGKSNRSADGSSSRNASACRKTTAFLSSRLLPLGPPELEKYRQTLLTEDIINAMRNATRQGFSPEATVSVALKQAAEFDRSTKDALATAADTDGFGTTDDDFLSRLKSGSLRVARCEGIRNNALCAAITYKMSALMWRAMAAEMQCHIRAGSWPK